MPALLVTGLLASSGCSSEPSCDDVAHYNDQVQEAGQKDFDEDSMNEYAQAQRNLAAAESDCAEKGEEPEY